MTTDVERRWRDHYNRTARSYDRKESLWSLLLGYSEERERRKMFERLNLRPGQRVLEVNAGTGANLRLASEALGAERWIVAQDISVEALKVCREKLTRLGVSVDLVESDSARLPFANHSFDALLSFGGVSQFGDPKSAIEEMVRVVKPGAAVVIGDVGVRPERRGSVRKRLLLRANPRYASEPPTNLLPPNVSDLSVDWFRNDTCYLIHCRKSQSSE